MHQFIPENKTSSLTTDEFWIKSSTHDLEPGFLSFLPSQGLYILFHMNPFHHFMSLTGSFSHHITLSFSPTFKDFQLNLIFLGYFRKNLCVCLCMHACMCLSKQAYVEARVFLSCFSTLFLEVEALLTDWLARSQDPLPLPPSIPHALFLCVFWGSERRSLCLCPKHFTH